MFDIDRLELAFTPKPWPFAVERRAEIDAYFAKLQREKPALWNGRVLLLHHQVVRDGVFRGDYLETDYASFSAWRALGPSAGRRARLFRRGGGYRRRRRLPARGHGAAHVPCGRNLFSLRHARSR